MKNIIKFLIITNISYLIMNYLLNRNLMNNLIQYYYVNKFYY